MINGVTHILNGLHEVKKSILKNMSMAVSDFGGVL